MNEREIIEKAQQGDHEAFTLLMQQHSPYLRNVLFTYCTEDNREDILQEVWLHVFKHIKQYRFKAKFRTWLTRVAINEALMYIRHNSSKANKAVMFVDDDTLHKASDKCTAVRSCAFDAAYAAELRHIIDKGMSYLMPSRKTALQLYMLDGLKLDEIANVMGVPVGAVKGYVHHASKQLRKHVEALMGGEAPIIMHCANPNCNIALAKYSRKLRYCAVCYYDRHKRNMRERKRQERAAAASA